MIAIDILDHGGSVQPNVSDMHQEHETSLSKLFKVLGVPIFLYTRDNDMKVSSNYDVLSASSPLPNAAAGAPGQPVVALMPAIAITRKFVSAESERRWP